MKALQNELIMSKAQWNDSNLGLGTGVHIWTEIQRRCLTVPFFGTLLSVQ